MLHTSHEIRRGSGNPERHIPGKLFLPKGAVGSSAIAVARAAGWDAELVRSEEQNLDIEVGGVMLSFGNSGTPLQLTGETWGSGKDRPGAIAQKMLTPWEVAINAVMSTISCSFVHAVVLAPVGAYASLQSEGAIDSLVLSPVMIEEWKDGAVVTANLVTVGHTRCWLVCVLATCEHASSAPDLIGTMQTSDRLLMPPAWMTLRDTATLCEYMRDLGWPDARFPDVVLMSSKVVGQGANATLQIWLAATDACVSVFLAEAIGRIAAPHLSTKERFRLLRNVCGTPVQNG